VSYLKNYQLKILSNQMIKFAAIIEARMNSNRLPGKILFKSCGKPMLKHLVDRIKKVKKINRIIIATTTNKKDDLLIKFAKKNRIMFYRGSELNVKKRVLDAANKFKVKNIVSITSDCPIIDYNLISQVIETFENHKVDFVSNCDFRSYPDGMDVAVYKTNALKKSYKLTKSKYYREHVTLFMKHNKKIFNQINIFAPENIHYPKLGLTLDEYKDYVLIDKILNHFRKEKNIFFTCEDVVKYINSNKTLKKINSQVRRKKIKVIF